MKQTTLEFETYPLSMHQKYSRPASVEEQETCETKIQRKQWLYKDNWFSFLNHVWLVWTDIFISSTPDRFRKQTQVFLDDVSPLSNGSRLLLQPTDFKSSSICVIKKWQSSNTQTLWEAKQFPFNRKLGLCTPVFRVYLHFIGNIQKLVFSV